MTDMSGTVLKFYTTENTHTVERPPGRVIGYLREHTAPGDLAPTEWEVMVGIGHEPGSLDCGRQRTLLAAAALAVIMAGLVDRAGASPPIRKPVVEVDRSWASDREWDRYSGLQPPLNGRD
jgi:hypothetical protein